MKKEVRESILRLFKALPIESKRKKKCSDALMKKTIDKGFVLSPEVVYNYDDKIVGKIESIIGLSGAKLNSSFHKSWQKVRDASIEQLVIEQVMHYITTYGYEEMGCYDKGTVFIPNEKLEIPESIGDIKLTFIKGYTKKELKEKLLELLESGIALKEETVKDVMEIVKFVGFDKKDIDKVKNKEVKIALYEYYKTVPETPIEFLRYCIYKATDGTLLIKSRSLIAQLKETDGKKIETLFNRYEKEYGLNKLASIFYRFKPIFLAFKISKKMKTRINRLRKLAVKFHKPMKEDYLNEVTAKIKNGKRITTKELNEELDKVNVFRKIRLAYALKFRTKDCESIVYKIRNGKGYATDFDFKNKSKAKSVLKTVLDSIAEDVKKNVKGKKIFIPENINYALPATEKQFVDAFPSGTYVSVPSDIIVGINWNNIKHKRIDLDLSLTNISGKFGWDDSYRGESGEVLFSGDITDANGKNGATELFYIKRQKKDVFMLMNNYYNYDESVDVPFKLFIATEKIARMQKNYMVNPDNVVTILNSKMDKKEKILGLLVTTSDECRFYFTETSIGKRISSRSSDVDDKSREYLVKFHENSIKLEDVLKKAGAKIINDEEKKEKCDIDLSPEDLEIDSILNLIK